MAKNNSNLISIICLVSALIIIGYILSTKNFFSFIKLPELQISKSKLQRPKIIQMINRTDKNVKIKTESTKSSTDTSKEISSKNIIKKNKVYQLKSEKDFKYQGHIIYSILKNWSQVSKNVNADLFMIIRVSKDGNIDSYEILKQSNDKNFQDLAIKSVLESVPYQKFKSSDTDYITYQVVFRGNDVRIGAYKTDLELPYQVKYKKIAKKPFDFNQTMLKSTVASAPGKYAYKVPNDMPILRNWTPPLDSPSEVNVIFDITKDGIIINEKVISSSGSQQAVQEALKALKSVKFSDVSEYIPGVQYRFEVKKSMW